MEFNIPDKVDISIFNYILVLDEAIEGDATANYRGDLYIYENDCFVSTVSSAKR